MSGSNNPCTFICHVPLLLYHTVSLWSGKTPLSWHREYSGTFSMGCVNWYTVNSLCWFRCKMIVLVSKGHGLFTCAHVCVQSMYVADEKVMSWKGISDHIFLGSMIQAALAPFQLCVSFGALRHRGKDFWDTQRLKLKQKYWVPPDSLSSLFCTDDNLFTGRQRNAYIILVMHFLKPVLIMQLCVFLPSYWLMCERMVSFHSESNFVYQLKLLLVTALIIS